MRDRGSVHPRWWRAILAMAIGVCAIGVASAVALGGPSPSIDPLTLSFTGVVGGPASDSQSVTVKNVGDGTTPLKVTAVSLVGDEFAIVNDGCTSASLAPGDSCAVAVAFTATTQGPASGTLTFTLDKGTGTPVTRDVELDGSGTTGSTTPPPPPPPPPPTTTTPPTTTVVTPPPTPNDLDKDKVPDSLDACPLVAGDPPSGCPKSTSTSDDRDNDGVANSADKCSSVPGNLSNGCPSKLNAVVHGHWRVNSLYSQLVTFTVKSAIGSRIVLGCSRSGCGFTKRTITKTIGRETNLARYFKGKRILPAGLSITVRVTRPKQIGTYQRLQTRAGRRLPKVTKRCLSALSGAVGICAS
jgi:hypothetical protein